MRACALNWVWAVYQVIQAVRDNVPKKDTFINIERCVWGPNYKQHPSYAYENRLCPQSVTGWATPSGCPLSDWSTWSMCDVNCGAGVRCVMIA